MSLNGAHSETIPNTLATPFAGQPSRLLTARERLLGRVSRWCIVPTIQRQSVAEHSFYVALMASRLAGFIRWKATNQDLFNLSRWSLLHDSLEAVTGDLPTPVKKHLTELKTAEHALLSEMGAEFARIRMSIEAGIPAWTDIARIVSFCDSLEALSFLHMEYLLGNRAVTTIAREIRQRVEREFPELPFGSNMSEDDKKAVWEQEVLPVIDGRQQTWPVVA